MSVSPQFLSSPIRNKERSILGGYVSVSDVQIHTKLEAIHESRSSPDIKFNYSQEGFREDLERLASCIKATEQKKQYANNWWKDLIKDDSVHSWVIGLALIHLIALEKILFARRLLSIKKRNSRLHNQQRFVAIRAGVEKNRVLLLEDLLRVKEEEKGPFVCEALIYSIRHRSSQIFDFLLEQHRSDVNYYAKNAIYEAATCGWSYALEKLSDATLFLEPSERGKALQLTCFHGHTEIARLLLKNGQPVFPRDRTIAVCKACQRESLDEELLLLLVEDPAAITHFVLVSLLERCAREGLQKLGGFLVQLEVIFSDREIAKAKEIAIKYGHEAIFEFISV